jgi:erythritol transport system ATP-binding protein
MNDDLILLASNIRKRYGGQTALDDVTFRVVRGAVNVLIGENGAGKSTLMRILAGVEQADAGKLHKNGEVVELHSPRDATRCGIGIVHQELALLPNLDIAENIFAGRELVRSIGRALGWIDRPHEDERSTRALSQLRTPMSAQTSVAELALGRQQIVELARTLAHGAEILILDEPTSALSNAETEALFAVMAELKREGVTVIYISHRLHELLHLGDHFTVLRGGKVVGEASRAEVDRAWIVERMSGRRVAVEEARSQCAPSEAAFEVRGLTNAIVRDVSFIVGSGEIVGIYGLLGSGRTELLESLAGARPSSGEVLLKGRSIKLRSVRQAMDSGVVLVPEDRQRDGLVPELSIRENIALGARGTWISKAAETKRIRELGSELRLRAADIELPVTSLSGGNQQKVLLARCLMRSPQVLLLDEPTRGVDVGAKAEIYETLRTLASRGLSILFASSEIEETQMLADRALVLRQGRIGAEFTRDAMTDEALFAAASPTVATMESAA